MKRFIFILLAFSPIFINAQTAWNLVVDDDLSHNLSKVTDVALFQDSVILVSGILNKASCSYQNLFAYNTHGERLWSARGTHDVINTDSGYIYTAGFTFIDDVPGHEELIISKFDKYGDEIFSIGHPDLPNDHPFEFKPKNIELASDGTILVSSELSIVTLNANGQDIQEYNLNLATPINAIHALTPTTYLINTKNKIYKTDNAFNLTDSIEFSKSLNKLKFENDTLFALFDTHLLRLDTDLQIIDTLIESSVDLFTMEFYDDNLWLQTVHFDSLRLINLQSSGNPDTLTFPIFADHIQTIVTEDGFTFIGNSFSNQIGIYHYQPQDGELETVSLPDIELVDFHMDDIEIDYVQIPGDTFAQGFYFRIELTVKNRGLAPINTFAAFSKLDGGVNCSRNFLYQKITDLEIPPGQTHTIILDRAYQFGINNTEICIRCLAPNSELETIVDNNILCKTFTITGIDEKVALNPFKIFPNPVSDYAIIESADHHLKTIEIFDINGRILISKVVSGSTVKVETSDLIPGLYIVRMGAEDRIHTQLIVKE